MQNYLSIIISISTNRLIIVGILSITCINPPFIGTPISTQKMEISIVILLLCQSPIYRDTHFYSCGRHWRLSSVQCVSIPYLSGHPFLHLDIGLIRTVTPTCVNPLSIGTPISTKIILNLIVIKIISVNPLSIGTPISTGGQKMKKTSIERLCQSPIYRDTHFYCRQKGTLKQLVGCVNPLSIGTPISTMDEALTSENGRGCVNPLSIGTPISTQ